MKGLEVKEEKVKPGPRAEGEGPKPTEVVVDGK